MSRPLFGAKPLPEIMLTCCIPIYCEQITFKMHIMHCRKCIWNVPRNLCSCLNVCFICSDVTERKQFALVKCEMLYAFSLTCCWICFFIYAILNNRNTCTMDIIYFRIAARQRDWSYANKNLVQVYGVTRKNTNKLFIGICCVSPWSHPVTGER